MNIIDVENLNVIYGANEEEKLVTAIENVSFEVEQGSFVAIIGKNGSGKSTLAKTLNALILPNDGTVYVKGIDTKDADKVWEIRQTCGMVFQNPDNQLVSAVVEDDVAFGPENLGIPPKEIRERVDLALEQVNMTEYKTKAPHLLSGGQKQRIAIAGVLAMKPECIILDEPTAMLDPKGRREVIEIVKSLNAEGITVILITHFMEEAAEADRLMIMDYGKKAIMGSPEEVFVDWSKVKELGVDVPLALDFTLALRNKGIEIDKNYINIDELVDFISDKYKKTGTDNKINEPPSLEPPNISKEDIKISESEIDKKSCVSENVQELLEIRNLTHVYSKGMPYETKAVDDISFKVNKGEFIGIIGHTGSGKSTLIQHLNGILKPTSGKIILNGKDLTEPKTSLPEVRKKIGLVFQYPEYQLFEETVEKDVAFGPKNLGLSEEEISERVKWALDTVGISYEKFGQISPFELSGGQRRRVAIAGVIAMKPEILILDEPTAGLDPKSHRDILNMIKSFHESQGASIFLVSHNMGDIAELSDRIIVMDKGKIKMMGEPHEIFSKSDTLRSLGLGLPPATEVLLRLKNKGLPINCRGLSLQEAIEEIIEVI